MKSYFFLPTLFLLSACQLPTSTQLPTAPSTGESKNPPVVGISPTLTPAPTTTGTTTTNSLKIEIKQANNFDSAGLALLEKARSLLELVVNSDEFKNQILNFTYQGQAAFVQNDGLTNEQVYNRIMAGAEQYPKATSEDHTADLYLELYTSSWFGRNTIGYTSPSISTVYMNTYYFNYADASAVADNMMHEWLHKLGFDHDSNATARRPYSVPYAVGYIVEALVKKLQ